MRPLALALAVPALLASPAAAVPNLATWNGPAAVAPCGAGTCLTGDTGSCTAVTAGSGPAACAATLSGSLSGPGCAGTGTGTVVLREATGEEHTVSGTLAAAGGVVSFSGRYVFLFDRTAYTVTATVGCGAGRWSGTFAGRGL